MQTTLDVRRRGSRVEEHVHQHGLAPAYRTPEINAFRYFRFRILLKNVRQDPLPYRGLGALGRRGCVGGQPCVESIELRQIVEINFNKLSPNN